MSVTVLDSATLDAVALATTQPEQLDAIEAAFAGDITVRAMAGSTVAEVCTYGPWVRDSAEPRGMTLGALAASTVNVPDATITSFVFVDGSTPIFSIPAADASLDSPTTKTGRRTSLADAVLTKHRIIADATLPLGTTTTYLLTFALADTATVDVAISGSIVNTGTGACAWSITPPAHVSVTPSSGTLAAGGTQSLSVEADTAGTYDLTLVSSGTTITGATQTVVASLAPATSLTLSVPSTGTAGVTVNVTATPNGPVAGGGTATLSTTAGALGSTTLTWSAGESAAKTTTLTLATAGSADVSLTTGLSLGISGSPARFTAAEHVPAWISGAAIHEWVSLGASSVLGGNTSRPTFSNIALHGTEVILAATGGHSDYSGNDVSGCDVSVDSPTWTTRRAAYGSPVTDAAYYRTTPTVEPTAAHRYNTVQWSEYHQRLVLHKTNEAWGSAYSYGASNGFDLTTNQFDAAGTFSDGQRALCQDANGDCWASKSYFELWKWTESTDTWALVATHGGEITESLCADTSRGTLYQFSWRDNLGSGTASTRSYRYSSGGTVQTAITLNSIGGALAQFEAGTPTNMALVYDPDGDRFLVWDGTNLHLYQITPNAGTTWDFEEVTTTGVTVPARVGGFSRIQYISALKCVVVMPATNQPLYGMRLA